MDDLTVWLNEQIDEDERVARLATPGPWRYNPATAWHTPENLPELLDGAEFVGAGPADATIGVAATGPADHPQSMADALFIARHDPTTALAETAAKRRILAEHSPDGVGMCRTCAVELKDGHDRGKVEWPCLTVRLLALPSASRPGYRDEWRP